MNSKLLLPTLLILSLTPLAAQACPSGHPQSLAYIRRDNNRCEGLQEWNITNSFGLISFSTGNLTNYPNTLNIRVPGTGRTPPDISLQSFDKNYRLDQIAANSSPSGFTFVLNTNVLKRARIRAYSLRALAFTTRNSEAVYFPVILGQPSSKYEFVVYSPQRTTFPTFEIRRNGTPINRKPRNTPQQGQIRYTWDYGNAPAGVYELYIVDGQGKSRLFRFEHNPKWL